MDGVVIIDAFVELGAYGAIFFIIVTSLPTRQWRFSSALMSCVFETQYEEVGLRVTSDESRFDVINGTYAALLYAIT